MISKPSILFVCDIPNWAFHNIARFVEREFSLDYDIYIDFLLHYESFNFKELLSRKWVRPKMAYIKACYVNYKKFGSTKPHRKVKSNGIYNTVVFFEGIMEQKYRPKISVEKIVKGIYTDIYPPFAYPKEPQLNIEQFIKKYFSNADAMICGCANTVNRYSPYFPLIFAANATADQNLFKKNLSKRKDNFVIGWTGNPARIDKGFYDIILPAIDQVRKTYPEIIFKTQFRGTLESLAEFYQDVDLIVIASKEDAGPSLFMEASLCDIPTISTLIGWPMEVIEHEVNGLLIERNSNDMANAIIKLYQDRELLKNMSKRIKADFITVVGPGIMKKTWIEVFKTIGIFNIETNLN